MNNKQIGTAFERMIVRKLAEEGYWVHFISPDVRGAQPFDIIAAKNGKVLVGDCKTCKDHIFRISRLEENQRLAFEKWVACGNPDPVIFVEYKNSIKILQYSDLKKKRGRIDLDVV